MARKDGRLSILAPAALGMAVLVSVCVADHAIGRLMLLALAGWGLVSLPIGLLAGHYCALGDDPAR